jgi:hypothetical protein
MAQPHPSAVPNAAGMLAASFDGVRCQVGDVIRSIHFYTNRLGFKASINSRQRLRTSRSGRCTCS